MSFVVPERRRSRSMPLLSKTDDEVTSSDQWQRESYSESRDKCWSTARDAIMEDDPREWQLGDTL